MHTMANNVSEPKNIHLRTKIKQVFFLFYIQDQKLYQNKTTHVSHVSRNTRFHFN